MNGEDLPLNGATVAEAVVATQILAPQEPSQEEIAASLAAAALPQAPLAMPKQKLERANGLLLGRVLAVFGAGKRRAQG